MVYHKCLGDLGDVLMRHTMRKTLSSLFLILFILGPVICYASYIQIHPPWGEDGNKAFIQKFGKDKYLICKTATAAAVNECITSLGAEGGEVYLPEGTYSLTSTIAVTQSNTTLTGSGPGTIIKVAADITAITVTPNKTGIIIRNMTLDGDSVAVSALASLINIVDSGATIENVTFKNFEEWGLYCGSINNADSQMVKNCVFRDKADNSCTAIYYSAGQNTTLHVDNCDFYNLYRGISSNNGAMRITSCRFYDVDDSPIYYTSVGVAVIDYSSIIGCFFKANGMDIYMSTYSGNNVISSNVFIGSTVSSIELFGTGGVIITNNVFENPANISYQVGINTTNAHNIVSNNVFRCEALDTDYFLQLVDTDENVIIGNTFDTDVDVAAIYLHAASINNIFAGNQNMTVACTADPCIYGEFEVPSPLTEFALRRPQKEVKTDNYVITTTDLGKTLVMNSADDKTFSLPSVGAGEDGSLIYISKISTGKVTIDAADTDYIHDSTAGSGIYNQNGQNYASITLRYNHSDTRWYIIDASGTWVTY